MRRRIQKKILLDHPYFDYKPDAVLSGKETERIFNSGFPDFEEMVGCAKNQFNVPPDAWSDFDKAAASRTAKSHRKAGINFIAGHKRLAVVLAAVLLLISFFTLIPYGRALAADFFNMIIRVFEGRIEISSENPDYNNYDYVNLTANEYNIDNKGGSESNENDFTFYPDIEDFVSKTGYIPVAISADWLECQTIQSIDDEDTGLILTVKYITKDGYNINVTQRWSTEQDMAVQVDASYNKTVILGNADLLYATDPVDGSFNGTAVLNDSILTIGAEKGVDIEQLIKEME